MIRYLLDTNVVSQPSKENPNSLVMAWLATASDSELAVSALTIRELAYGVVRAEADGNSRAQRWAEGLENVRSAFAGRILPIDDAVAIEWAQLLAKQWKHVDDKCLVATAKVNGLVLVTGNEDHTTGFGVAVLNPFKKGGKLIKP